MRGRSPLKNLRGVWGGRSPPRGRAGGAEGPPGNDLSTYLFYYNFNINILFFPIEVDLIHEFANYLNEDTTELYIFFNNYAYAVVSLITHASIPPGNPTYLIH